MSNYYGFAQPPGLKVQNLDWFGRMTLHGNPQIGLVYEHWHGFSKEAVRDGHHFLPAVQEVCFRSCVKTNKRDATVPPGS